MSIRLTEKQARQILLNYHAKGQAAGKKNEIKANARARPKKARKTKEPVSEIFLLYKESGTYKGERITFEEFKKRDITDARTKRSKDVTQGCVEFHKKT